MIAVADTSPISALLRTDRLTLLTSLFEPVLVPPEVVAELDEGKHVLGDWRSRAGAMALSTRDVRNRTLLVQLSGELHRGEAAAIALASEVQGSVLVIDESDGRETARRLGLRVTGTLGVIVEAKRRGQLPQVAPVIEELRTTGALWLGEEIVKHALALAGER
jgi:predicted nucleic acid-binding protein